MYTLWVIAKSCSSGSSLVASLVGNHAVRLFASLQSFRTLALLAKRAAPDGIVIDFDTMAGESVAVTAAEVLAVAPGIPIVVVTAHRHCGGSAGEAYKIVARDPDLMRLERLVTEALAGLERPNRRVMRFKDIALDMDTLRLRRGAGEDSADIPLKEAQILRLFLERPGICLSRQEISDVLWQCVKVTPRTIDSHVSRLRKRLVSATVTIESVYGDGYILR